MDRNQELALESRVMQFSQAYLKEATAQEPKTTLVLDEKGETHLRSLLYEADYLREGETPVYRRLSVERQTGKPAIDVFEFRDVLSKDKGFSYICLSNQDEWDAYVEAREKRYAGNANAGAFWGMLIGGLIVGGFADLIGGVEAHQSQTWNPSNWWLLVPPVLLGCASLALGGYLENSGEEQVQKNITLFQEQYGHRISTGPKAILKAFGYNLQEISPVG